MMDRFAGALETGYESKTRIGIRALKNKSLQCKGSISHKQEKATINCG